jgi:hypothetical protein
MNESFCFNLGHKMFNITVDTVAIPGERGRIQIRFCHVVSLCVHLVIEEINKVFARRACRVDEVLFFGRRINR